MICKSVATPYLRLIDQEDSPASGIPHRVKKPAKKIGRRQPIFKKMDKHKLSTWFLH